VNAQGTQWDCKYIPVNAQGEQRGCIVSGDGPGVQRIELVYVCVCEGAEGRLGCRCILYSILYVTSILLVPVQT